MNLKSRFNIRPMTICHFLPFAALFALLLEIYPDRAMFYLFQFKNGAQISTLEHALVLDSGFAIVQKKHDSYGLMRLDGYPEEGIVLTVLKETHLNYAKAMALGTIAEMPVKSGRCKAYKKIQDVKYMSDFRYYFEGFRVEISVLNSPSPTQKDIEAFCGAIRRELSSEQK